MPVFSYRNHLAEPAKNYPIPEAPERPEEFSPGLDPELQEMADALINAREKIKKQMKPGGKYGKSTGKK